MLKYLHFIRVYIVKVKNDDFPSDELYFLFRIAAPHKWIDGVH